METPGTNLNDIELITPEQAAKAMKVSVDCVRKWMQRGKLPYFKLDEGKNGTVRLSLNDIKIFLQSHRIEALSRTPVVTSETENN